MPFLTIKSRRIEYVRLQAQETEAQTPTIVMLHEGLGSIAMWQGFPQQVADATGCEVLVYSRHNYGHSDPIGSDYGIDFMHKEALKTLPEVLDQLNIKKPILFGHSDGGSIALIHAGGAQRDLNGIILMAPHVLFERVGVSAAMATKEAYVNTNLRERLARYHVHVDAAFYGWANFWLNPEFLYWNIEEYLSPISCPVLAIQGTDDEYGTMQQIDIIGRKVKDVELLKLPRCRHSAHKDQPLAVLKAVADFVEKILIATKRQNKL